MTPQQDAERRALIHQLSKLPKDDILAFTELLLETLGPFADMYSPELYGSQHADVPLHVRKGDGPTQTVTVGDYRLARRVMDIRYLSDGHGIPTTVGRLKKYGAAIAFVQQDDR